METILLSVIAVCLVVLTLYLTIILFFFGKLLKVTTEVVLKIGRNIDKIECIIDDAGDLVKKAKETVLIISGLAQNPFVGIVTLITGIIQKFKTKKQDDEINPV